MPLSLPVGTYFDSRETIPVADGLLLTRTVHQPRRKMPAHFHQTPYLTIVVKGGYAEDGEGFSDEFGPGYVVYHPGKEVHSNRIGSKGAALINLELEPSFWRARDIDGLRPAGRIIRKDERVLSLARELASTTPNPTRQTLIGIEGRALSIIDAFLALHSQPTSAFELMDDVEGYLRDHFSQALTSQHLANRFNVDGRWLSKMFKQTYGESIRDRVARLRINRSAVLLSETTMSISEISTEIGFFDQSHFTKLFKRKMGLPPGNYRLRQAHI